MSFAFFQQQLAIGQVYEEKAIERVCNASHHKYSLVCRNNDNRFDFELSNGKKYEVKADLMAVKTGNIYVEVMSFHKPAGLAVTKAHFYIIMYHTPTGSIFTPLQENYVRVSVRKLKRLLNERKYRYSSDEYKGGYLVPIEDIAEIGMLL